MSSFCKPEEMESEDPLFIMYTSGTTGKPTGIVHTQAGYLLYAAMTHKVRTNNYIKFLMSLQYFMLIVTYISTIFYAACV